MQHGAWGLSAHLAPVALISRMANSSATALPTVHLHMVQHQHQLTNPSSNVAGMICHSLTQPGYALPRSPCKAAPPSPATPRSAAGLAAGGRRTRVWSSRCDAPRKKHSGAAIEKKHSAPSVPKVGCGSDKILQGDVFGPRRRSGNL